MTRKIGIFCLLLFLANDTSATVYNLPSNNRALIGQIQFTRGGFKDNAATIAQRFDIGHNALTNANPSLERSKSLWWSSLKIPNQYLLPDLPREGIVINLPEMRMYYYPIGTNKVLTYPIGIGKIGKTIPITKASITKKTKNPSWIPPEDIREFNLEQGIVVPKIMPPGPDNPLGPFAIYMSVPTYLIHSTIFPESIGKRASFGCIRMYEKDIQEFFPSVEGGIPVVIINSPIKFAWQDNHLYMEAHQSLDEHHQAFDSTLPGVFHTVASTAKQTPALIDWQLIAFIEKERDGIPHEVGMKL